MVLFELYFAVRNDTEFIYGSLQSCLVQLTNKLHFSDIHGSINAMGRVQSK